MFALALRAARAARVPLAFGPTAAVLLSFVALLAWDAGGLDLPLATLAGTAHGFPLREQWALTRLLHDGARWVSWLLVFGLCAAVWWPVGALARLPVQLRLQLAASTLLAAFAVSALKGFSVTSCPWDLQAFGGVARYVSHWSGLVDGGAGHCFPAGHAAAGFAYVSGYFAFRRHDAVLARRWLLAALAAGFLLGLAQQLRGAHFMSHTLWTAWICWTVCWALDGLHRKFSLTET